MNTNHRLRPDFRRGSWAAAIGLPSAFTVLAWLASHSVLGEPACGTAALGDATPESSEKAERLLRRLSSGSIGERDTAERGLVELGSAALPWVEAARRRAVGEAAYRLTGIQRSLERQATEEAVEPAIVTLAAEDLSPRDILRDLFARAGSEIDIAPTAAGGPAVDRRISLRCDRMTFWEAIGEVLDRSGLVLEFVPAQHTATDGRRLMQRLSIAEDVQGRPPPAPAATAGPLRVSVTEIERTGKPGADAAQDRSRGMRITLRVAWEPRLRPLLMRLPARSLVAEGAGGESVPPAQRTAVIEATIPSQAAWIDLPIVLAAPAVPVDRLAMLRGTVIVWLTGMEHTFCFMGVRADRTPASAAIDRPVRVAQAEARLREARFDGGRLLVSADVTYDVASEPLASHHSWLAARGLEACTAGGRRLDRVEQQLTARTDRGATVTAEFTLPPGWGEQPPAAREEIAIRWTLPIAIHELPVDFMLRDVVLVASDPR